MFKKLGFIGSFFSTPLGGFIIAALVAIAGLSFLLHQRALEIKKLDAEVIEQEIKLQQNIETTEALVVVAKVNDIVTADVIRETLKASEATANRKAKLVENVTVVKNKYAPIKNKATPETKPSIEQEEVQALSEVKITAIWEAYCNAATCTGDEHA